MSAIITNNFRRNSCENFINQLQTNQNSYFIGIGKSDKWPDSTSYSEDDQLFSVPLPNGTIIEDQDVLDNLISLVKVQQQDILTPKNRWESGRTYKVYDPYDPLTFDLEGSDYPCYMTFNNNIFVCLDNDNGSASTFNPGDNYIAFDTVNHVLVTDDGYTWAFIQTINQSSAFYTEQFVPVNLEGDAATAKAATGGLVYNFKIDNGGVNLDTNDVTIKLKGVDEYGVAIETIELTTDERFSVSFGVGSISSISYTESLDSPVGPGIRVNPLMGYAKASIEVYEGVSFLDDVRIRPLIASIDGFGAHPRKDIPSYYAGCYARFSGVVDGEALIDTPIRQVSLIENPQRNDNSPVGSDQGVEYDDIEALDAVNYIQFNAGTLTVAYPAGSFITQGEAKVYVDRVDLLNDRVFYHTNSNHNVNYIPLLASQSITMTSEDGVSSDTIADTNIDSIITSEYVHDTGEVLFVDHRKKIVRNVDQTEDVKIVIQF